jgi:hypothetical protein
LSPSSSIISADKQAKTMTVSFVLAWIPVLSSCILMRFSSAKICVGIPEFGRELNRVDENLAGVINFYRAFSMSNEANMNPSSVWGACDAFLIVGTFLRLCRIHFSLLIL